MSNPLRWGISPSSQVKPPLAKRNAGHQAGRPEAAQYENWWKDLTARSIERVAMAFMAVESDAPNMTVRVLAGAIFNGAALTEVAVQVIGPIVAPTANPRLDLVYVDRLTGTAGVLTGAEAESPVAPALPVGKIPVALLKLSVGQTSVTNPDITDIRTAYGNNLPIAVPATTVVVSMSNAGVPSTLAAPGGATSLLQSTTGGALDWVTTLPSTLTIPAPTIDDPTMTGGGSFSGTYSGDPTFSGNPILAKAVPASPVSNALYAGAGRWVTFDKKTGGGSSYDFTSMIDGRFISIRFLLIGIVGDTADVSLQCQFSKDAGVSWDITAAHYFYIYGGSVTGPTTYLGQGAIFNLLDNVKNSGVPLGINGEAQMQDPSNTVREKRLYHHHSYLENAGGWRTGSGEIQKTVNASEPVSGLRFKFSSGIIASGTIIAEGLLNT